MPLELTRTDAAALLVRHQFGPTATGEASGEASGEPTEEASVASVFERLGGVQYDPLAPLGTNHDLVLQARAPNYRIGGWWPYAYEARGAFDGWDKQASLVRMGDWTLQSVHHRWRGARWRREVLDAHPAETDAVLAELRERGPLEVGDFEFQRDVPAWQGSWYGPRLTKRIVRALWHTGRVATHHRRAGRHVYDLTERVIPAGVRGPAPDERDATRALVLKRHRTVGLLRPTAPSEVWSLGVNAAARRAAIAELVAAGELVEIDVAGERYHAAPEALAALDAPPAAGVRFVAPLDPLLWDRGAVERLHRFEYLWEVYKPAAERRWGYYVLPVLWGERFVARIDAVRTETTRGPTLAVSRWWWEPGAPLGANGAAPASFLADLETAVAHFARYLGVRRATARAGVPKDVAAAVRAGAASAG